MKKILLNTKTYIGPINRGYIDFYSIYKNRLYVISEKKFKYILDYLQIQFPDKSKIGFDISKWLHQRTLLNENFLSEISSKILKVPKDFSESDVFYSLSTEKERITILSLFEESLKSAYIYDILKNSKKDFIFVFTDFLVKNEQNSDVSELLKAFYLYFFSDTNHIFSKEIQNLKLPAIVLKDKFFFERIGKFMDVIRCGEVFKRYFFPKRYTLEFLLEEKPEIDMQKLLENMFEINARRLNFEHKIFRKIFSFNAEKPFKLCNNTNFSFINFETVVFLILFLDENFDIKFDNTICNFLKRKELLNYFTNIKTSFIESGIELLEPYNYAKIKFTPF